MSKVKRLLVPGGLGFVGSHTIVSIIQQTSAKVVIIDNMSNCYDDVLDRIKLILSKEFSSKELQERIIFHKGSILDLQFLDEIFKQYQEKKEPIDGIMHFAAKKAIGQSYEFPMVYYENNVIGSINLFKMMEKHKDCKNFIFSSTAGVYGNKDNCKETDPSNPTSPYGQSKVCVEMLLSSLAKVHDDWRIISLRYFNPCGAHDSWLLGDEPSVHPNNLFPYIQEVIIGKRPQLNIFGNDYPTPDGTCVRDYLHIMDLANGHIMAMNKLQSLTETNIQVFNLGTGCGYSVMEIIKGFEKALGHSFKWEVTARRFGDVPKLLANIDKASQKLGWKVTKTLEDMCRDSVNFITKRVQCKPK